ERKCPQRQQDGQRGYQPSGPRPDHEFGFSQYPDCGIASAKIATCGVAGIETPRAVVSSAFRCSATGPSSTLWRLPRRNVCTCPGTGASAGGCAANAAVWSTPRLGRIFGRPDPCSSNDESFGPLCPDNAAGSARGDSASAGSA